jgi:hypothetical protein
VANRRTRHLSTTRTTSLLLILIALLFALLVAATPASAYEDWEHGGAKESTCDSSGCHKDKPATNTACVGCHSGYTTSGAQKCWDCHEPGAAPPVSCAGSCHLFQANGDNPAYPTAFSHGVTPHLGASGYGKSCVDCHGVGTVHHDAATGHQPTCAECHNGTTAKLPPASHNDGQHTNCSTCHVGMNKPTTDCAACHVGNQGSGGPQIAYTNDLACSAAGCHGKVKNHVGASITGAACTTCHVSHFEALGACTKCHADPQSFHHGTARVTPLADCATCHNGSTAAAPTGHQAYGTQCATCHTGMNRPSGDCAGCHDGTIASAKQAHAGMSCTSCHTGMARPPVPATCQNCHDAQTFGAVTCTTCHSTSGMIGKETIHATDPAATVACTTCHEKHYEDLGACKTCHGSHAQTHHGTATLADTQLTLVAKPSLIKAHKKATLKGMLLAGGKALASQKVLIQRKVKGGSYKKVAVVKTRADGRFSRVVRPRVGTEYRAVWRPAGAYVLQQRPAIVTVKLRVRK